MKKHGIFWLIMVMLMPVANSQEGTLILQENTIKRRLTVYEVREWKLKESLFQLTDIYSGNSAIEQDLEVLEKLIAKNSGNQKIKIDGLAWAFYNAEQTFGIPAVLLQAIAFIESSYRVNAVNKSSNDYGIMQVNSYNIKAYGFNKTKLLTDLQYGVNAGARVFYWFYKRYPLDEAIMRYNCGTRPKCIKLPQVRAYLNKFKAAL